jgi:hypothetical protein
METSIRSAFVILVGIVTSTACAGTTIAAAQGTEISVADSAPPGACSAAIARVESALNEARAGGRPIAAPQSIGAQLHRQPTRDSVAKAEKESVKRVEDSLATARQLRSQGKHSECVSILERIAISADIR